MGDLERVRTSMECEFWKAQEWGTEKDHSGKQKTTVGCLIVRLLRE